MVSGWQSAGKRVPFPQLRSPLPRGPQELCALLGKGAQLFSWVIEVTKAKWPPDGAGSPALRTAPPTPHPVPHPVPRQPGGGVSQGRQRWWRLRLAPGRGGGGEEKRVGRRPARPALWPRGGSGGNKTFPARGRGRGGGGPGRRRASGTPSWAGPLPLPPGAGEPIRPPRPLLQDPMTQRWEQGGGGLGWLLPYRPSPLVIQASSTLLSPTYPSFAGPPLHNSLPGKGNRNQEGGVSEGRGSPSPPYTAKTPRGMGAGQGFGPKPCTP